VFSERIDDRTNTENMKFDETALKVRKICRDFTKESIKTQIESFIRWGIMHDYRHSYMSINPNYEANVIETFATMLNKGLVYRGKRPVFWSADDQRVLAEEEIEEMTRLGNTHLVKFKIKKFGEANSDLKNLGDISVLAFVNEPWKLTSTYALAVNPEIRYTLIKSSRYEYLIVALDRVGEL
jgi:isoleucyl-tRNA synthetase